MSEVNPDEKGARHPILIDLGKQKKKHVKKLRKGRGKLMEDIGEVVERLVAEGEVEAGAQPIVIVVRQKDKDKGWAGMRVF